MPYQVPAGGWDGVAAFMGQVGWRARQVTGVASTVIRHNLDTVEGCRDAIAAMNGVNEFVMGDLVAEEIQFPNGWLDRYLTTYDEEFVRLWNGLHRALEARDTAIPKDGQVNRPNNGGGAPGPTNEKTTLSLQDNRKRIEELIDALLAYSSKATNLWTRRRFEEHFNLTWQAGGGGDGGAGGGDE